MYTWFYVYSVYTFCPIGLFHLKCMHSCMQFLSVCPQGKDTQKFVCARVLEICLSWGESIRSFPRGIDNLKIVQGWLQFLCHRVEKHHLRRQ